MIKNLIIIFKNFNSKLKFSFFFSITIVFFSSFIELVGISAFLPLINFLTTDNVTTDPFFLKISDYLNFLKPSNYVIFCISIIMIVIFIKSIFLIYVQYIINNFIKDVKIFFQNFLLKKYIFANISFHNKQNTNDLMNSILSTTEVSTGAGIGSIINLFKEIFVLILILSFLLVINFEVTIIAMFFLLSLVSIYYYFVKIKLYNYGKSEILFNNNIYKNITETFKSIKEIKTYFLEKLFISKNLVDFSELEKNRASRTTLTSSPRNILELILVFTLCSLIYYVNYYTGTDKKDLLGLLGIFALASMRLLPSVNSIIRFLQNLKYGSEAIKRVSDEFISFKFKENEKKKIILTNQLNNINISNLCFAYSSYKEKGGETEIFNNANIEIYKGVTGIIGESGSGKSTLIEIIMGFLKPKSAKILINKDSIDLSNGFRFSNIAYVPQKSFILDNSLLNNVTFQKEENVNMDLYNEIINLVGLKQILSGYSNKDKIRTGEDGGMFSGGQIQRISIARALYSNPNLLILDESTNALDSESERLLLGNIIKFMKNKFIIIISHRKELNEFCNKIYKINNKKIIQFK